MFDRTSEGRIIKNLTVVDDATHETVAIVRERTLGGQQLTHILDQLTKTTRAEVAPRIRTVG